MTLLLLVGQVYGSPKVETANIVAYSVVCASMVMVRIYSCYDWSVRCQKLTTRTTSQPTTVTVFGEVMFKQRHALAYCIGLEQAAAYVGIALVEVVVDDGGVGVGSGNV